MNHLIFALLTVVFAALPAVAWSDQIVLNPVMDNTIFQDSSSLSGGGEIGIFVGSNNAAGAPSRRGLIQFDVAGGLPAGVTITNATLTLYLEQANNATARTVELHRLNSEWGEGTAGAGMLSGAGFAAGNGDATWTENHHNVSTWTAGGDIVVAPSASLSVAGNTVGTPYVWSSAALLSDVSGWYANGANNHGWDVINTSEGVAQSVKVFYSREFSTVSLRPALTVTYVPEPGTALLALIGATLWLNVRRRTD